MKLREEHKTTEMLNRLVKAGHMLSKQLRLTGASTIQRKDFHGVERDLMILEKLEVINYSDCADLDTIYAGHTSNWDDAKWQSEILKAW